MILEVNQIISKMSQLISETSLVINAHQSAIFVIVYTIGHPNAPTEIDIVNQIKIIVQLY